MRSVFYILVVLILLVYNYWTADAGTFGASSTSCFTHVIIHEREGFPEIVRDCDGGNPNCRNVRLSVRCEDTNGSCCEGLNVNGTKYLYTTCSYILQWDTVPNLGFLIQARVDPGHTRQFSNATEIIGTWTPRTKTRVLNCRSSISTPDSEPSLPNSITHLMPYTANDIDRPPVLDMSWRAESTITTDNTNLRNPINITFFHTISRDISTNFYPSTREDLSFELRPHPLTPFPTDPPTSSPTSLPPASTLGNMEGLESNSTSGATTGAALSLSAMLAAVLTQGIVG